MKRIKITDNFCLDEFVHPDMYAQFYERSRLFIRPELFAIAQAIRNHFGSLTINSYALGGQLKESGLRMPNTLTGAKYSMHKYGCAIDIHPSKATPEEIREFVISHYDIFKGLGLRRMEIDTPTWVHLDVGNTGSDVLILFKP